MANKIQIKRSTTGGATPTLSAGELAVNLLDKRLFTANDTVVFDAIQNTASNVSITSDGTMVLRVGNTTTNAVVNSTSIKLINSTSNTTLALPTATERGENRYLKVDGTWSTVTASATPGGSNTHVQYNDSGSLNGTAGFTYDETTNNVVIANTLTVNNLVVNESLSVNTDTFSLGNSTVNSTINSISVYITNSTVNTTLSIPTSAQWTATNYFLHANGSWVAVTGGGTPGGGAADVQYSNNGTFAGNSGFQFTYSTNNVTIANTLTISSGGTGINPGSNTLALGNSIGRWVITANSVATQGFAGNATALNPTSNTILLGNTIGRWVITANSVATQGVEANATALNPVGNTILLGNTIGRWVITANSVATQGFAGNATSLDPTSNTITFGNSIGRWVITANSVATQGFAGNATALNPTANTILLGNSIGQWVITANSLTTTAAVVNATGITVTVGGNTITANGTGLTIANSTGNTITLKAPTTTEKGENRYLKVDGTWSTVSATAGASGSNTNIQFNNSGDLGGSNGFTFDNTTNNVYIANTLTVDGALVVNTDAFGVGSADANTVMTASGIYISNSTSNTRIEVPNTTMYSSTNYVLHANGSWITAPGGASASGANTEIQYNVNGTTLGANAFFRYASDSGSLFIGNSTSTTTTLSLLIGNSTINNFSNSTVTRIQTNSTSNSVINSSSAYFNVNSTANVHLDYGNWLACLSKSVTILDPVNTDSVTVFHTREALTLSSIRAVVRGTTPSVTISIYSATDRTATTTTHINANVVSNTTTGNTLTSFGSAAIAANSFVYLTVTAVSGTVNEFHATLSMV